MVATRIHKVAPASAARTKEYAGVVRRRLCGVKTENSRPEIRIAETLPMPVKSPPQRRGLRFGGEPDEAGIISDATLVPTSFSPLAKARANRGATPTSSHDNINASKFGTFLDLRLFPAL